MRKLTGVLAGLFLAAALPAQTADEIIASYVKTIGGMEKLEAIKTLKKTGRYTSGGGLEAKVFEESKRPDLVRQELVLQGMTGITAWDGKTGWKIEPWQGKKDVEPLGEEERKQILEDADFDGPLVNYRQKGNTVELRRQGTGRGHRCLEAEGDAEGGGRAVLLHGHGLLRSDQDREDAHGPRRAARVGDFDRRLQGGRGRGTSRTPSSPARKGSANRAKVVYDKIEANVPLDDSRFAARPAGAGEVRRAMRTRGMIAASLLIGIGITLNAQTVKIDSETISGLGARNIGSAAMSGRIAALDAVREGERLTVLHRRGVAAASGSRSTAARLQARLRQAAGRSRSAPSTIDPKNPKTVWVGTGEAWTRNSVSIGDGIYKSDRRRRQLDQRRPRRRPSASPRSSWIRPPPTPSTPARPASSGATRDERGVFKTTDGGKTWTKVLKGANLSTGCSMISMDSQNPKTLYAGMWDFRRKGWTFRSGGDGPTAPSGSGLFKSTDGGATWTDAQREAAKGLPSKPWGRVAVTVAPSKPSVVYAFIEASRQERPLPLRRRRQDLAADGPQPEHGLAALLLRAPHRRSEGPEQGLQAGPRPHRLSTDGGKSFTDIGGGATATSTTSGSTRRTPTTSSPATTAASGIPTTAATVVEGRQPADLAVLPRERRHGPAVSTCTAACRTTAPGSAMSAYPGGITNQQLGEHATAATASGCSPTRPTRLHLRRGAGRRDRTHQPQDAREPPHQAAARVQGDASSATTGTRRST